MKNTKYLWPMAKNTPGSLDSLTPVNLDDPFANAATYGSAIKTDFNNIQVGDIFCFNWDLTLAFDEERRTFDADKAFVTINGAITLVC